jgi:hypothetical protein
MGDLMKQIASVSGKLEYQGPDDPPAEYYKLTTLDGRTVWIGFDATQWGGDIYKGIPGFPESTTKCTINIFDEG